MQRTIFRTALTAALLVAGQISAGAQALPPATIQNPDAPKIGGGADLGSAQLTALVAGDGTLMPGQSKGTLPCTGAGGKCGSGVAGLYQVNFARNLSGCTAMVSTNGYYHAAVSVLTTSVSVGIATANGSTNISAPFSLLVIC